ncbi:MauE/DoxX family redox-associated membrane protein [Longirhabdus pacifica]|uniref:MauE/DoxX family redox-associated membrane protein n=1 Tax=Longirhabdus pacifica TaxID=2305227 RepID=UPI0013E8A910|nr:MauE/DoxX family redox-associated membrane protein [Longirhabdus pacifica]
MEYIWLIAKFLIVIMFFSTAYEKWKNIDEHIAIIKAYDIIPDSMVKVFAWTNIGIEFLAVLCLAVGFQHTIGYVFIIALLCMYATAISINLIRGNKEISCGCGGVLGNHQLSWWLVLRNTAMIALTIMLMSNTGVIGNLDLLGSGNSLSQIYPPIFFIVFLITITTVVSIYYMTSLKKVAEVTKNLSVR